MEYSTTLKVLKRSRVVLPPFVERSLGSQAFENHLRVLWSAASASMLPQDAPKYSGQHAAAVTEEYIIGTKLFVGNLNFKTTQADVEDLFAEAGDIEEVFLPADRNTGRPRGFAFVTFVDEDSAQEAIEKFDGYDLGGRPLRVNEATERPSRGPMGGGGFDDNFGGGKPPKPQGRPKGSRRNMRAKKRSL